MTTYTFKDITLEHDREWRAWRRLEKSTLQEGDQIKVQDSWLDVTEYAWGEETIGEIRYRRPVPLPNLGELVEAISHRGFSLKVFTHPESGEETIILAKAYYWLRTLLPGYEEQLAKVKEPPHQYADPQTGEPRYNVLACPDCGLRYHDTTDVSHCDCGHRIDQMVSEYARSALQQPSPVPGDGWRGIETAPKDSIRVIGAVPHFVIGDVYFGKGPIRHHLARDAKYVTSQMEDAWRYSTGGEKVEPHQQPTHWQPLPPPPQEKGGEA